MSPPSFRRVAPFSVRPPDPMAKSKPVPKPAESPKPEAPKAAAAVNASKPAKPAPAGKAKVEPAVPAASTQDLTASVSSYLLRTQKNEDEADAKLSPFLRKQKKRLLVLRDAMLDSMSGVAQDNLRARAEGNEASAFGMHQADAGSDAYDRDFALNLLSQEQDASTRSTRRSSALNWGPTAFARCQANRSITNVWRRFPLPVHRGIPVAARAPEQGPAGAAVRHVVVRVDRRRRR